MTTSHVAKKPGKKPEKKSKLNSLLPKSVKERIRLRIKNQKLWQRKTAKKTVRRGKKSSKPKTNQETEKNNLLDKLQVEQAVKAVRNLSESQKKEAIGLLEATNEDDVFYLQVTIKKLAQAGGKPNPITIKVALPHTLVTDSTDVALITRMLNSEHGARHEQTLNYFKQFLSERNSAQHITEIIPLRQLRMEYHEFEAKRQLAQRTDVLLAEGCVMKDLPKLLGKPFYESNKRPITVNLNAKNLENEIKHVLSISQLHISMAGDNALMKIGLFSQSDEAIISNIEAAAMKLSSILPGGWANVSNLSIKTQTSDCLPVYIKLDNAPIKMPQLKPMESTVGTVSTLSDDTEVTVTKAGNVIVKRNGVTLSEKDIDEILDGDKRRKPKSKKSKGAAGKPKAKPTDKPKKRKPRNKEKKTKRV